MLPYDSDRGAAYYIAKYITKEPLGWDLGGLVCEGDAPVKATICRKSSEVERLDLPRSSVHMRPVDGDAPIVYRTPPAPPKPVEGDDPPPDRFHHPGWS